MSLKQQLDALTVSLDTVPAQYHNFVQPTAEQRMRSAVASGAVPMPSEALLAALCYLMSDPVSQIAQKARETLAGLQPSILEGVARESTSAAVLHEIARACVEMPVVIARVLVNANSHDETFHFLARSGKGNMLEIIAHNQVRLVRYPVIAEALYFNPHVKMATVSMVLESCVRLKVDISHIPGYQEIVESVLGMGQVKAGQESEEEVSLEDLEDTAGVSEDEFQELLQSVQGEGDSDARGQLNWAQIKDLSLAQKVRLAIIGNLGARSVLIRDAKKIVCMAVMKSPRLTEKEVISFCKNKALNETIISYIARRKEWVKNYEVRKSLTFNPKTPTNLALRFVSTMTDRDLKTLKKNKEVPSYVMQAAARLAQVREQRRR